MTLFVDIGVDPGLDGAIAAIWPDGTYRVWDAPSERDGKKRRYLVAEMRRLVAAAMGDRRAAPHLVRATIEAVHAMPEQGVASAFTFGEGYGLWRGVLAGLEIATDLVSPQRWKKAMLDGMGKEKAAAVIRAEQLFPRAELRGPRGGAIDGRAEALLIAEHGRRVRGAAARTEEEGILL